MNRLSESLFQKSFADCSAEELRQLTAQYPYFAPAHILLLKKFDPATEEYRRHYQRAQLYFHDPVSFEFFLHRPEELLEEEERQAPEAEATALPAYETPASLEEHEIGIVEEAEAPEVPELVAAAPEMPPVAETQPEAEEPDPEEHPEAAPESDSPVPVLAGIDLSAPPTGDLSFEPYHAVDYFASQGIKLSKEEVGTDKFGKQLKSFTDWLKTMKRIAPEESGRLDARSEARVDNLADHSVQEAEIVTESMAEVWLKQGNKAKAIAIYRKLSLLHPAKSAYFADKINSLNV